MSANLHGLEFPDGLFYAPDYNLWLREEVDGSLTLGLSAYGCALYGEIFAFTPKRDGWHIERDRSFGVVEFARLPPRPAARWPGPCWRATRRWSSARR